MAEGKVALEEAAEDVSAAIEASEFNENLQETLYDGVLGFGLAVGNSVTLFASAAIPEVDYLLSVLVGAVAIALVALLLFSMQAFSDGLQEPKANRGVFAAFVLGILGSFVCSLSGLGYVSLALAAISLVTSFVMYSGFLAILPHKSLMAVVDIAFIYSGFMLLAFSSASKFFAIIQGVAIAVSVVFTILFQTRYVVRHKTISSEDSKRNNVKVKGNTHTLILVGFMLGIGSCIIEVAGDVSIAFTTIGIAVLCSGLASLLLRSLEEKPIKEAMKKTMAACSCILLLVPLLPFELKLVVLGVYLLFVCLNMNFILNAIVESSRFNMISSVWLFGHQGGMFALGILSGLALLAVGAFAGSYIDNASLYVVALAVFAISCLQIKVNYQVYPFEEVLEEVEPEVIPEVESAGRRRALWQQKIDTTCTLYKLSPREIEVLHILLRGRDVKYIMDKFCISQSTAKTHVYNIYRKLGIHSRQELIDFVEEIEVVSEVSE